jgi:hypothetical protein
VLARLPVQALLFKSEIFNIRTLDLSAGVRFSNAKEASILSLTLLLEYFPTR